MTKLLRNTFRLLRPRQWIKNFAIFAALIFSGQLLNLSDLVKVFFGFLIFCALSSAIYIINDIFDIKKDRLHPFKRFRPLASKQVPLQLAGALAFTLAMGSILLSYLINPAFFLIALVYFVLHVLYSMFLKHIEIVDILTLAGGSILRFFAGEVI